MSISAIVIRAHVPSLPLVPVVFLGHGLIRQVVPGSEACHKGDVIIRPVRLVIEVEKLQRSVIICIGIVAGPVGEILGRIALEPDTVTYTAVGPGCRARAVSQEIHLPERLVPGLVVCVGNHVDEHL